MPFMNAEITDKQWWLEIDGNCGTEFIPSDLFELDAMRKLLNDETKNEETRLADILAAVRDYCENRSLFSASLTYGYGVRSSASGYMDCTSWSVYTRKHEATAAARQEQRECEGTAD